MDAACNVEQGRDEIGENKRESKSRLSKPDSELIHDVSANSVRVVQARQASNTKHLDKSSETNEDENGKASTHGKEVAIQANEYEIERGSSHLPQRRRFVPLRFSDYRVFASNVKEEEEEEEEDSNFNPSNSNTKSSSVKPSKVKRARGRPRKYPDNDPQHEPLAAVFKDGTDTVKKEIIKAPNGFKCNICERVFSLRGNAKAHLITHSDEKPFPCDFAGCDKKLRTKESLRRHKLSHMGIKMFECTECKKKFSCNLSLQEHMTLHTGEKPLKCEVCGKKFRQVAVLKRHLTTHSNSKPFACGLCGRRFALKVYVHSHMKTHTGERPFTCDICNKSFAHASDLNRHKIIHSGKKPYQCSICSMRYSDPSSRRRHEREHQNKQQYICHICSQRFPRAGQLRVHIVKEHSSEQASLPAYRVEMDLKSTSRVQKTWVDNDKVTITTEANNTSVPPINSSLVNQQATDAQTMTTSLEGGGEDDAFINSVQPQTVQLVLDGAGSEQVGCIVPMPEGIVIQESAPGTNKNSGETMIMELPRAGEEFIDLQSQNCTYRIVNSDDKNQVYELHLEGTQLPFQEVTNAVKINLTDLKIKDRTVALIQDGDSLTVINQPEIESAIKIDEDSLTVRTDDAIAKESLTLSTEKETPKEVSSQHPDTSAATKNDLDGVQKTSVSDQNSDILLDHTTEALNVSGDESMSITELKSVDPMPDVDEETNLTLSTISPILDSDFVSHPDLNSQEYYNWLAAFSEACKHLALPLDKEMFLRISQVQKTLSDYMAIPSGVISDKNNFKILMNITQDLSSITSSHLSLMYSNLTQ